MERFNELRLEIHSHTDTGELTLKLHGPFDSTAAVKVHDAIKELPRAARTRVDFADCQTISDHAVVQFIQLIPAAERRVSAVGAQHAPSEAAQVPLARRGASPTDH